MDTEYFQKPAVRSYAEGGLEVLKFETKEGVFYTLPETLPKGKRTLRHGLEEILGECANESKERLLSADSKNLFPNYVLRLPPGPDENVLRVCEAFVYISKTLHLGRKIGPISRTIYSSSLGASLGALLYRLLYGAPSGALGNFFEIFYFGAFTSFLASTFLKDKYGNFGWDPEGLKDRVFLHYATLSDGGLAKLNDLCSKANLEICKVE